MLKKNNVKIVKVQNPIKTWEKVDIQKNAKDAFLSHLQFQL